MKVPRCPRLDDGSRFPHRLDRCSDLLERGAHIDQDMGSDALTFNEQCDQHMLCPHIRIAHRASLREGELDNGLYPRCWDRVRYGNLVAGGLRDVADDAVGAGKVDVEPLQHGARHGVGLAQQCEQEVLGTDIAGVRALCLFLRQREDSLGRIVEALEGVHGSDVTSGWRVPPVCPDRPELVRGQDDWKLGSSLYVPSVGSSVRHGNTQAMPAHGDHSSAAVAYGPGFSLSSKLDETGRRTSATVPGLQRSAIGHLGSPKVGDSVGRRMEPQPPPLDGWPQPLPPPLYETPPAPPPWAATTAAAASSQSHVVRWILGASALLAVAAVVIVTLVGWHPAGLTSSPTSRVTTNPTSPASATTAATPSPTPVPAAVAEAGQLYLAAVAPVNADGDRFLAALEADEALPCTCSPGEFAVRADAIAVIPSIESDTEAMQVVLQEIKHDVPALGADI